MVQVQVFIKNKADYLVALRKALKHFYKYYEERHKAQSHNGLLKERK